MLSKRIKAIGAPRWLGFSALAAGAQMVLFRADLLDPPGQIAAVWLSALLFAGAGLYRFSPIKGACFGKCRTQQTFFVAHRVERRPVSFKAIGNLRQLIFGKAIHGKGVPAGGASADRDIIVTNTEYWMGPDITVATATRGRVRAFGRVWDFDGRSAEIGQINWRGPR